MLYPATVGSGFGSQATVTVAEQATPAKAGSSKLAMTSRMIEQKNRGVFLSKLLFLCFFITDPFKMRTLKLQTDEWSGHVS
jgi:hypothetical protein